MSQRSRLRSLLLLALCGVASALLLPALFADQPKPKDTRKAIGKALPSGMLLARQSADGAWQVVAGGGEVSTRDTLVALPGEHTGLKTDNGAVEVQLSGNLPQMSDSPALEATVVLHEPEAGIDLDFTLVDGRVFLINRRAQGAAQVRCRFGETVAEISLDEPEATLALEFYSRILPGVPFNQDPKQAAQPASELDFLAVKGGAAVKVEGRLQHLQPPPGPAMTRWSSGEGLEGSAQRVEQLPAWAQPGATSPADRYVRQDLDKLAGLLKEKPIDGALRSLLNDAANEKDPGRAGIHRGFALYSMSAVGDVAGLVDLLTEGKSQEARAGAIDALRHWIGRAPGNDIGVYKLFLEKKYTPGHAEIATDLLHSFSNAQQRQPETLDLLLRYVKSSRLAIREEARWHLRRIVPRASEVLYDPAGPAQEQERAYQEWKKRIPARPEGDR